MICEVEFGWPQKAKSNSLGADMLVIEEYEDPALSSPEYRDWVGTISGSANQRVAVLADGYI